MVLQTILKFEGRHGTDRSRPLLVFTMTSMENKKQEILHELRNVSLKMQQLVERKKVLCIMKELKKRVSDEPLHEMDEKNEQELINIEGKLNQLDTIRAELQKRHDKLNEDQIQKPRKVSFSAESLPSSTPQIFFVESPPDFPAPQVILDYENLQFKPTKTQCPECSEFITTKISMSVSSITWLACMMTAMMGCVAGCCLLPFCLDSFKSTVHKCPKCNTLISTVKKL